MIFIKYKDKFNTEAYCICDYILERKRNIVAIRSFKIRSRNPDTFGPKLCMSSIPKNKIIKIVTEDGERIYV